MSNKEKVSGIDLLILFGIIAFAALIMSLIFGCKSPGTFTDLTDAFEVDLLVDVVGELPEWDGYDLDQKKVKLEEGLARTKNPFYIQRLQKELDRVNTLIQIRDAPPPPEPTPVPGPRPDGTQTFLWKPIGESTGNLVVLFPNKYYGTTETAHVINADGAVETQETLHTEERNGFRPHYRFSKPGAAYGNNVKVVLEFKAGTELDPVTWTIPNGSKRSEID